MENVQSALAVYAPFFLVMVTLVAPGVISVVNRIKSVFKKKAVDGWVWWLVSVAVSTAVSFFAAYLFGTVELFVPPVPVVAAIGVLTGLQASGLVDLSKFLAGTDR